MCPDIRWDGMVAILGSLIMQKKVTSLRWEYNRPFCDISGDRRRQFVSVIQQILHILHCSLYALTKRRQGSFQQLLFYLKLPNGIRNSVIRKLSQYLYIFSKIQLSSTKFTFNTGFLRKQHSQKLVESF